MKIFPVFLENKLLKTKNGKLRTPSKQHIWQRGWWYGGLGWFLSFPLTLRYVRFCFSALLATTSTSQPNNQQKERDSIWAIKILACRQNNFLSSLEDVLLHLISHLKNFYYGITLWQLLYSLCMYKLFLLLLCKNKWGIYILILYISTTKPSTIELTTKNQPTLKTEKKIKIINDNSLLPILLISSSF